MSELGEHGIPDQPPEDLPDDTVWMPGLDETLRDIAYHQSGMNERTQLIVKLTAERDFLRAGTEKQARFIERQSAEIEELRATEPTRRIADALERIADALEYATDSDGWFTVRLFEGYR